MSRQPGILVAGLGSAHGDDQVGWLVIEQLASAAPLNSDVMIRKAAVPLDLLDWLDDIDTLHVCDACQGEPGDVPVRRYLWSKGQLSPCQPMDSGPALSLASQHRGGSHDFGLLEVLQLAEATGRLPRRVFIWAISGSAFLPNESIPDKTLRVAAETAECIRHELRILEASNA